MDKEESKDCKDCCKGMHHHHRGGGNAGGGAIYGIGVFGAAVYYFQHSVIFMDYVVGFLKALVWPAFLIHKVFTMLGM